MECILNTFTWNHTQRISDNFLQLLTLKQCIMKFRKIIYLLPLLLVAMLTSCESDENGATNGRLIVQITDEPFPHDLVAEANVTINKIEIRKSDDAEESPYLTLSEDEVSLNLLDLTNGVTTTLADLDVPTGEYDLVRLYMDEASVVLNNGDEYDLTVPSGAQTGIKIFVKPSIVVTGDLTSELLLDVDVNNSFVVQGNPDTPAGINGFLFTPVIRATNLSDAGSLKGFITDTDGTRLEGAMVSVFAADTLHTTSFSSYEGNYAILGLQAGEYDVEISLRDYVMQQFEDVEITPENTTILDVEMEAEEE